MLKLKKIMYVGLLALVTVAVVGCKGSHTNKAGKDVHTFNQYLTVSPSNWNELSYQDNNDTEIMTFIKSDFYGFNFMFDEEGNIVDGKFAIEPIMASGKPVDLTANYVGQYDIKEGDTSRVWKFTLRDDLKWEDGTPIDAHDFEYTMKEQLNPDFVHYRADSYYVGSSVIHNAENYVKQHVASLTTIKSTMKLLGFETLEDLFEAYPDTLAYVNWNYSFGVQIVKGEDGKYEHEVVDAEGNKTMAPNISETAPVDETIESEFTLAELYEIFTKYGPSSVAENQAYFLDEVSIYATSHETSWDEVGFKATGDYELTVIYDLPLNLLDDNGEMTYECAYSFGGFPLVNEDLYERCKQKPVGGSELWTSKYHTSVDTTLSYGPYKLTSFQRDKQFVLERNDEWFGYALDQFKGQYETDRIVTDIIKEWNTAWMAFQKGDITTIGLDVSVAKDYKGSDRAIFTPDDFVGSLQLQSSEEALEKNQKDGENKTMLTYVEFRKALALGFNRAVYNTTCTTSSLPGYGLFGPIHYYDVANGGVYRDTDAAKTTLCNTYGVDPADFDSLDEAVESITGYDQAQARTLITEAYKKAIADGKISATDKVVLKMGTATDNESTRRVYNFFKQTWTELMVGTPLEGRFVLDFDASFGSKWANSFRAGEYDVCTGGWTGAAWNPGYFLLAYLSPAYMYSAAWDTSTEEMTLTMPVVENGETVEKELTMGLLEWYDCLNGVPTAPYDWSSSAVSESVRLKLIAALENVILTKYYTVPMSYSYGASLVGYKIEYITTTYNTFMSYGGIRYITYNYDDAQWAAHVKAEGGTLNYK